MDTSFAKSNEGFSYGPMALKQVSGGGMIQEFEGHELTGDVRNRTIVLTESSVRVVMVLIAWKRECDPETGIDEHGAHASAFRRSVQIVIYVDGTIVGNFIPRIGRDRGNEFVHPCKGLRSTLLRFSA